MPIASIIVPIHGANECTSRMLDSLYSTTRELDIEVILVCDACSKEQIDKLREHIGENWWIIGHNTQQLFTRTTNRGFRAANPESELLIEINTDCILKEHWLEEILSIMNQIPMAGVVGYDGYDETIIEHIDPYSYVTGHCIALRRTMLDEIGLLCETDTGLPGTWGWENGKPLGQAHIGSKHSLCIRARNNGWRVFQICKDLVIHEGGKSWGYKLDWLRDFPRNQLWTGRDGW